MGNEAPCKAKVDGKALAGKALLETREIVFRADGARVIVPLREVKEITARAGVLDVRWGGRRLQLELGADADKWLKKIQNPPSLLDKLGVKPESRVGLAGVDDPAFLADLRGRTAAVGPVQKGNDLIFFRAETAGDLAQLGKLMKQLDPAGAIWVVRPKGKKEITEAQVMAAGKAAGLIDVKVAAFSETHTAEKYVIPVAKRPPDSARQKR